LGLLLIENRVLQSCKAGKILPEDSFSILVKNSDSIGNFFTQETGATRITTKKNSSPCLPQTPVAKTIELGKYSQNNSTDFALISLPPLPHTAPFQPLDIFNNLKLNKELSFNFPKAHGRSSHFGSGT